MCVIPRLDRAMDMTDTLQAQDERRELETELETWDWARTAGVSADELRQALRAALSDPALRAGA